MKISKEIKTGVIAIAAIGLLIAGVNFLKGNSFFGGDDVYYAYFPNSGQIVPSSNVTLNGVVVGKVLSVDYVAKGTPDKKVKMSFSIKNSDVRIPKGSSIEIGGLDLFSKGLILSLNEASSSFLKPGATLEGSISLDMMGQVKSFADPLSKKVQTALVSIDKMVNSLSSFWDKKASSDIEDSFRELRETLRHFGSAAQDIELLVQEEKVKFAHIMSNIEAISSNLKKSNDQVTSIIGNTKKITDDLVTADFKTVVGNANQTLKTMNTLLDKAQKGEGTLGKLLGDTKLYDELVKTNKEMQQLVADIKLHPERYIHFSLIGAKTKGVPMTAEEEKKWRQLLDSTSKN